MDTGSYGGLGSITNHLEACQGHGVKYHSRETDTGRVGLCKQVNASITKV